MTLQWQDTPRCYGLVSRALHWLMALVFAWQFFGMATKLVLGRTPLTAFLVGTHRPVGLILLVLILTRLAWAWYSRRQRPAYVAGATGSLARVGHVLLYTLMLIIPSLALLRQIGSGKAFSAFGLEVSQETGVKVAWMTTPADWLHGILAWSLLVLIVGHAAMALVHHYRLKDDTLVRMLGRY